LGERSREVVERAVMEMGSSAGFILELSQSAKGQALDYARDSLFRKPLMQNPRRELYFKFINFTLFL
jgi:hypothetical protein